MAEKVTTQENPNELPSIHPDDAKDKVFTAILKALLKMGNKPSSPKELANIIVKYKYATLGGATPFATVSSRISQHFKRAAEHNPPRAPLLAKHIDQKHSRKINYSLAHDTAADKHTSIDQNIRVPDPTRTNSKIRRFPSSQLSSNHDPKIIKKHKLTHQYPTPTSSQQQQIQQHEEEEEEEESYHEDMLKGDHLNIIHTGSSSSTIPKAADNNSNTHDSSSTSSSKKPSFSFGGDQELWTPFSFEHDFDNMFLHDVSSSSTANNIPLNIATPESISVSELDNYFANSTTSSSSSSHTKRKSFSSTMLGPNDKSILQKVLLESVARGVAEKNQQQDDSQKGKESVNSRQTTEKQKAPLTTSSSSSLMDVTNGEDFVQFEEDEKKEAASSSAPPKKILPATPTSAAEILKSMNIQNLNLAALQQVTNNIPSLQHLSSTLDLAKTLAAYMQSLAKSASTSSSPSSSTHATDLKTILTRFPVLEAFIKKDITSATPPPTPSPPTTTTTTLTSENSHPIIPTLTPTNPPMFITLIDHVAVCVAILESTEFTPEYRIMRRVDSGFINGTILLTAGGIDTESERSMILSFEMERVRMPKKKSPLFGTWIPLHRAQELAATCSVQHKLGHFLDDSIDALFPSPLPIPVKKPRDTSRRLTALALAALRSERTLEMLRHREESSDSTDDDEESDHLEELLSRVASTKQQQPLHIHPKDLQKKKRVMKRAVPSNTTTTTITIKRVKKDVVAKKKKIAEEEEEEEEDEDIDIGGSDCDDDLR